jgi:hypothetical protein
MALEGYIDDGGERIIRQFSDKGVPSRWLPPATAANHATAAPSKSPAAVMNGVITTLRRQADLSADGASQAREFRD